MKFALTEEISYQVLSRSEHITNLSFDLEAYFSNKFYGKSINTFFIGIICVSPEFEFFFKIRKKHQKTKKYLGYDVQLDFEKFRNLPESSLKAFMLEAIIDSLEIARSFNIEDFNIDQFKKGLEDFYNDTK